MEDLESLVMFDDAMKALGENKFGGYLVRFSSPKDPDLTGDFFTHETDYDVDFPAKSTVYFNHGLDKELKHRKLGKADLSVDEVGVWAEFIMQERDDYEKALAELARAGKLGWSSGTAAHLVEREQEGKTYKIKRWPLGLDASITHTPAEPRNGVMALKSYAGYLYAATYRYNRGIGGTEVWRYQEIDSDSDGIPDHIDNCPSNCNSEQLDADGDGVGDVCDTTPGCGCCGQAQCEQEC